MSLFTRALLGVTERKPVEKLITSSRAGRSLARRFVAGETLEEALRVAAGLNRRGTAVSLDHLGEEVTDRGSALAARKDYLACLDRIAADGLDANISIKLTQLGLTFEEALVMEALDELGEAARQAGTTVTIDMEDSRFTQFTVELYEQAQQVHGNFGLALQAYLYRSPADLARLLPAGGHIRLCKGAYLEPPEVAFQVKEEVDVAFARLLETLMGDQLVSPAVATHDADLIDLTRRLAAKRSEPFEFQMLYGVRPALQQELTRQGYPLRVYVPYGSQWYPYLTRRLAERPANLGFFLRALAGR
ncbi:MAG: proline dehydrogenase family protein [Acidimicrobiia bacterium]